MIYLNRWTIKMQSALADCTQNGKKTLKNYE